MEVEQLANQFETDLKAHEHNSQQRHEKILSKLSESKMTEPVSVKNIFDGNPAASVIPALMGNQSGGMGAGLGAGLLGGVLGGVLLNRNGVLGGNNGDGGGFVTPSMLATSLGTVTESLNNSTILQTLGDIKAAVPYNEAQVQLALGRSTADVIGQINSVGQNLNTELSLITKAVTDGTATTLAAASQVKDSVTAYGTANLTATQNAQYALATAIRDDGDKTRALLISQNDATLNRQLAVAETALAEQRAAARSRDVEVNVTQNVNQNQVQQQQQIQLQTLATNLGILAANQQHISQGIVNLGTMSGHAGQQTAANTRVNS